MLLSLIIVLSSLIGAFLFSIVKLSCNGSSSENYTYLNQAASSSIASPCNYKICPCSKNICRIRYDFSVSMCALGRKGN